MSDMQRQVEKLDERVDRIDVTLARVEERLKIVHDLMVEHKAQTADIANQSLEAHKRLDNIWFKLIKDLRWAALVLTSLGGAAYFIWGLVK